MQRRTLLHTLVGTAATVVLPWLGACGSPQPLRLGIHPWIGYEPLKLARSYQWLPQQVALFETPDLTATSTALQAGVVDAGCLTLDEVLRIRSLGVPLTVIAVLDVSDGADMVLAHPRIRSLQDLKGKRIAMERGPLATLMLSGLLEKAALSVSDVQVVYLNPDLQVKAWTAGEVDAVIAYEPNATLLLRAGAKRIFDSREMPDTIVDVLAMRVDRMHFSQELMRGLLQAHFKGLSHLRTHTEDANYRIAASQGISPVEVRRALTGVVLPSLEANRDYLAPDGRLLRAASVLSARLVQQKVLPTNDRLADLVRADWLPHGGA